ncbi:MAG: NYN domain-containing protein [Clostridia bacterium]|nr:NYN domain-containing protein [Clostridia bacterium]
METILPENYMTEMPEDASVSIRYYENKKELVTRMAFLTGVHDKFFSEDTDLFIREPYEQFRSNDRAMIIRSLCLLRNSIEHNFRHLNNAMRKEGRAFFALNDYFPKEALDYIEQKGIRLPTSGRNLTDIIIEINRIIGDRINNCRDLLPSWIKWDYIRELFIMPNGQKREGTQAAANLFYENKSLYPFGVYINWRPYDCGNLFANDYKFTTALYSWHGDSFIDLSNLSDVSDEIKNRIYDFIDNSNHAVLVVDCENADPYSLCAMFNCIDDVQANKIDKIILYDDPKAPSGWRFFEQHVNIEPEKIEHNIIQRLLDNKSLLDVKLTSRVTREYYRNNVDSFLLVSSDSDFWGLIEEIPDANFIIMLEHRKASRELRRVLDENGIFYCFTDDFYTGMDDSLKKQAMYSEFDSFFEKFSFNAKELFEDVLIKTRIEMVDGEKNQFYEKHLKNLQITVDKNGDVKIGLKK